MLLKHRRPLLNQFLGARGLGARFHPPADVCSQPAGKAGEGNENARGEERWRRQPSRSDAGSMTPANKLRLGGCRLLFHPSFPQQKSVGASRRCPRAGHSWQSRGPPSSPHVLALQLSPPKRFTGHAPSARKDPPTERNPSPSTNPCAGCLLPAAEAASINH